MEILVVGAGALGLLISGLITHNGGRVTLYSRRPEAIEHISKKGVRIITDNGEYIARVKCIGNIEKDTHYDLAIITVKSYDTETIAKLLNEKLSNQTLVLTLQNGLGNAETLASHLGKKRVFPGITTQASTRLGINEVYHAFNGLTVIGEYDGLSTERVKRISTILSSYGVRCIVSENIWREIWFKVMVNSVINPLTAIMKIKNEGLLKISFIELLIKDILSEIISVAKLYGYEFNLDECFEKIIKIIQDTRNNKSSMLQDVENKRRTEIDSLNGMITKLAEMHGLKTPLNRALTILVKGIEGRYSKMLS